MRKNPGLSSKKIYKTLQSFENITNHYKTFKKGVFAPHPFINARAILMESSFFLQYSCYSTFPNCREVVPSIRPTEFRKNVEYRFYVLGSNFIFMGKRSQTFLEPLP